MMKNAHHHWKSAGTWLARSSGDRLDRQRSFAICFGRKRFQIGMNQPPIAHQVLKRRSLPASGRRLRYARWNQRMEKTAAAIKTMNASNATRFSRLAAEPRSL